MRFSIRQAVREDATNPAMRAVVTRSGLLELPLEVSLVSNLPDELSIPTSVTVPATDILGKPRYVDKIIGGAKIDMGAIERQ